MTQEEAYSIEVDTTRIKDVRNAWTAYAHHRETGARGRETILAKIIMDLPESAGTPSQNGCIYTTRLSSVPDSFLEFLKKKGIPYRVCS